MADFFNRAVIIPELIRHLMFCKVGAFTKKPCEKAWQSTPYTYEEIVPWTNDGGSYGIMSGFNHLVTIDCDCKKYFDLALERLPPTLTIQSSSTERGHLLYSVPDFGERINKYVLVHPDHPEDGKEQGGDIRAKGFQTVGPGSYHPDTRQPYTVRDARPIAEVTFSMILDVFGEYFRTPIVSETAKEHVEGPAIGLSIMDVVSHYNISLTARQCGGEHFGTHPIHGSTGGHNFWVNDKDNTWCCFRCNTGGGSVSLVAVLEEVIDCSEARKGGLTGDKFNETCCIIEQNFGVKIKTGGSVGSAYTKPVVDEKVDFVDNWHANLFFTDGFPLDALPVNLRVFIQRVACSYRVPTDVVAVSSLAVISAAIGNTVRIAPKAGWLEPPFLWVNVVADTGTGKSPYMQCLIKPLVERDVELQRNFEEAEKSYGYKMAIFAARFKDAVRVAAKGVAPDDPHDAAEPFDEAAVDSCAKLEPEPPKREHGFVDDTTLEALAVTMNGTPRGLLLFKDELAGLILGFNQYKKGGGDDRQKFLTLWNCAPMKIDRAGGGSRMIERTGIAIMGGIQPALLGAVFGEDALLDGLLPRFISVFMEDPGFEFTKESVDDKDTEYWRDFLRSYFLVEPGEAPRIVAFDSEAQDGFYKYCKNLEDRFSYLPVKYKAFAPKLRSYLIRISGLFAVLNGKTVVDRTCIVQGAGVIEYIAGSLIQIFRLAQYQRFDGIQKNIIKAMAGLVDQVKNGRLALSMLREHVNSGLNEKFHLTGKIIAGRVRHLGFGTKEAGGYTEILWDQARLEKLLEQLKAPTSTKSSIPDKMAQYDV